MAAKKEQQKDLSVAKDSLRQDINEIKLLLGAILKDIDVIARIEKIKSGLDL